MCSSYKGQDLPWEGLNRGGSPEGGRTRWTGKQGDEVTLIAACRDVLHVVSPQEGSDYEDALEPVIEWAEDLCRRITTTKRRGIRQIVSLVGGKMSDLPKIARR